jgi:hypothetical protein
MAEPAGSLAAMAPLSLAGMGIGPKIAGNLGKTAFAIPNKLYQLRNQAKVNSMIKSGMWHGSQPTGHRGEEYLQGTNILDGPQSHDPHYGMGFFATSSKGEADLYASGYNSFSNWGSSFGSMNHILGAPRGKYIDFTKKSGSLKWQDYSLAKALGAKRNSYMGNFMPENLGDIMSQQGMTGAIMNRVNTGQVPKDIAGAKWLSWNNPAGVITKEKYSMGGMIPKFHEGGTVNTTFAGGETMALLQDKERVLTPQQWDLVTSRNSGGGDRVYQIAPVINASEGMDVHALADIATRKTLDAIKSIQYNERRANGEGRLMTK